MPETPDFDGLAAVDVVVAWLQSKGFVPDGQRWCIAWPCRSGYDFTGLEFSPLRRRANDQGWDAIVGHHASGTNPRLVIGRCETLAEVQLVYDTIRRINGYPSPDPS